MTLGVFVEGPSDRQTIPVLIGKVGYSAAVRPRIVRQAEMLNPAEMSRQVAALTRTHRRLRGILVFTDSEGVDPDETLRRTETVSARLNEQTRGIPVSYVVVDHSLEGWLACDVTALKGVLGPNATVRIRGNPEDCLRPARLMQRIFRRNGKRFVKTVHNPKIAELVTPRNVAAKSPTFRRFVAVLGGEPA